MKSSWVDQETSLMYGGESALQVELKKLAKATWDAVKGIAQMTPVAFLGLPFIPGLMHKAGVSGHIDSFGHQPDLAHPEFSPDASHVQYLDMDRAIDVGVLAPRFGMATDIESGTRVVDEAAISNVKGIFADQMGLTLASNDMAKWHVVEMQFTSEGGRPVDGKNVMHSDSWPQSESNLFAVQNADNPGEMFLLVGSEKGKGVAFDSPMAPNKENSVFVRLSPQVLGENNVAFNYGDQTFMQVAGGGEDQEVNIFVPGEHAPRALKLAMINASEDFVVTPTPPALNLEPTIIPTEITPVAYYEDINLPLPDGSTIPAVSFDQGQDAWTNPANSALSRAIDYAINVDGAKLNVMDHSRESQEGARWFKQLFKLPGMGDQVMGGVTVEVNPTNHKYVRFMLYNHGTDTFLVYVDKDNHLQLLVAENTDAKSTFDNWDSTGQSGFSVNINPAGPTFQP